MISCLDVCLFVGWVGIAAVIMSSLVGYVAGAFFNTMQLFRCCISCSVPFFSSFVVQVHNACCGGRKVTQVPRLWRNYLCFPLALLLHLSGKYRTKNSNLHSTSIVFASLGSRILPFFRYLYREFQHLVIGGSSTLLA